MAIPKVNWTGVDWRQSDEALAKLAPLPAQMLEPLAETRRVIRLSSVAA